MASQSSTPLKRKRSDLNNDFLVENSNTFCSSTDSDADLKKKLRRIDLNQHQQMDEESPLSPQSMAEVLSIENAQTEEELNQLFFQAMKFYDQRNYTKCKKHLEALTKKNHAPSEYFLGCFYCWGFAGITVNEKKGTEMCLESAPLALPFFSQHALLGNPTCLFAHGRILYFGHSIPANIEASIEYFKAAADQGHSRSQLVLGLIFEKGTKNIPKNFELGLKYFKASANAGEADAEAKLAEILYDQHNLEEAIYYYKLSAQQGNCKSQNNLSYFYFHGVGVKRNITKAANYAKLSAKNGNINSMFSLGHLYDTGIEMDAEKNSALSSHYFDLATKSGNPHSAAYAKMREEDGFDTEEKQFFNEGFC